MKRYIRSAGYSGYSMSNNAVDAYANGEKPLSKWTKADILSELENNGVSSEIIQLAKKLTLSQLKELFLYKSSWHHTSKMYNRTKFYSVDYDVSTSKVKSYIETINKSRPKYRYYKIFYKDQPCYALGDSFKFLIDTDTGISNVSCTLIKYNDIIEIYDDIPKGTESIFTELIEAYENN